MTFHRTYPIIRLALIVILTITEISYCASIDQPEDVCISVVRLITSHGFENVRAYFSSGTLDVEYENRIYFREKDALKIIIPELMEKVPDIQTISLFPKKDAVPLFQITISRDNYRASLGTEQSFFDQLVMSPVSKGHIHGDGTFNSSVGKVDITLHPFANIALGRLYDPFIPQYAIAPEFSVFYGKGIKSISRLRFMLYDELKMNNRKVSLDVFYLEYKYSQAILKDVSLSAGYFGENRYGISSDTVLFGWQSKLGFGCSTAFLGNIYYTDKIIYYTKMWNWTVLGDVYYKLPSLNMLVITRFGRFLHQDNGVSLSVVRFFNNVGMNVFIAKTDQGNIYGLELQLLTYPHRNFKPYYTRLRLPVVINVGYRYSEKIVGIKLSPLYNSLDQISESIWLMDF